MTNPSQWAAKRGTMPTTYSERKDGIATMFAEASEADLELYLDKIDKRIATCEFRRFVKNAYFKQAVEECKGNQCRAAKRIHVHRNTVGRAAREARA
jgi:DNA-binding protein Fis